nr:MAG TPA: hypothetical protein [Caudoviricetes sp.]
MGVKKGGVFTFLYHLRSCSHPMNLHLFREGVVTFYDSLELLLCI